MTSAASALGSLYHTSLGSQSYSAQSAATIWGAWNQPYASGLYSCSTGSAATSANITSANINIWVQWSTSYDESAQEIATREAAELAKAQATKRAEALLMQNLDPAQREQFKAERSFVVHAADRSRRYKVTYGTAGNIRLLSENGKEVAKFCIHPVMACPTEDVMLAQKLLIEGDEATFLRIANKTPLAIAA